MADFDVIVVGAGPVGLATSIICAGDGHKVLLLESSDLKKSTPRPIALNGETQRLLAQRVGLGDAWIEATWPVSIVKGPLGRSHFVSWFPDPEALDVLPDDKVTDTSNPIVRESVYAPGPSGYTDGTMFSPELEKQLLARARSLSNLEIRTQARFMDFFEDDSKGTVSVTYVPCDIEWRQTKNGEWLPIDKLEGCGSDQMISVGAEVEVKATGEQGKVTMTNGHAHKVCSKWYLTEELSNRGDKTLVTGRFLLGCDGVRSPVREALGRRMERTQFEKAATEVEERFQKVIKAQQADLEAKLRGTKIGLSFSDIRIVVDIALRDESIIGKKLAPHFLHTCDPRFPATIIPSAWVTTGEIGEESPQKRHWRFEFGVTKEEDRQDPDVFVKDEDAIYDLLQPRFERHEVSIVRAAIYKLTAGQTVMWRVGRAFLLGDAAHHTPTYMGQGLNQGFADVANLTWKLDLVLKGLATDALLDSYVTERIENNTNQIVASCRTGQLQTKLSKASSSGIEALRAGVAKMVEGIRKMPPAFLLWNKPLNGPGVVPPENGAAGSPMLGKTLPQPWVESEAQSKTRLDALMGNGFCLLLSSKGSTIAESKAAEELGKVGGRTVTLPEGVEAALGDLFADGVLAALIRPDRVVGGVARDVESAGMLVDKLVKSLST